MASNNGHLTRASVYFRSRLGGEQTKSLFEDIWRFYYPRLYLFARRMSIGPEEAGDVVQETMLKAYENIGNYNMKYALSTWLYTIARNHCLDTLRAHKTRSRYLIGDSQQDVAGSYPGPEEELLAAETSKALKSLIKTLSPADQNIAFLRFYEGCTYRQMSSILNIPAGTLKYRVHAIRNALKKRRYQYE